MVALKLSTEFPALLLGKVESFEDVEAALRNLDDILRNILRDGVEVSEDHAALLDNAVVRAWCVFDGTAGTPITPAADFNVTDVDRTATGTFDINLTSALPNANQVALCSGNSPMPNAFVSTTSIIRLLTRDSAGALANGTINSVLVLGAV